MDVVVVVVVTANIKHKTKMYDGKYFSMCMCETALCLLPV